MSGQGHPEAVRTVHQPVHGGRLRRLLQDGRRARRRRGMQHHPAGGLRTGHRAAHRRPPDDRRAHRAELRARPPGDHRDQRRLRPHQAPAAVPVVAAALDDLQGSLLLPEQAQQRRQPVHRRQLRGQHRHQGTGGPGSVAAEHRSRAHHLLDRPDYGIHGRVRQRASARGRHRGNLRRDHQRRPAARAKRTPTTRRYRGRPSRRARRRNRRARRPTRLPTPAHPSSSMPSPQTRRT